MEGRFEFLQKHKDEFDMSIISDEDKDYIESNLSDIALAYDGSKFGVKNDGYCLLLAYLLELIQRNAVQVDVS